MALYRTETNGFTNIGSPSSGNEITFNNTGTDLESTHIDDAIKEVNDKVDATDVKVDSVEDGDGTPTFTSSDVADGSATSWTTVPAVTSGETHKGLLAKMSQMFKNVRYLYKMLGTTDISSIGNGTVTNAISTLNGNLTNVNKYNLTDVATINTDYINLHNYGTNAIHVYGKMAILNISFTVVNNPLSNSMITINNNSLRPKYRTNARLEVDTGGSYCWLETDGGLKGYLGSGYTFCAFIPYFLA